MAHVVELLAYGTLLLWFRQRGMQGGMPCSLTMVPILLLSHPLSPSKTVAPGRSLSSTAATSEALHCLALKPHRAPFLVTRHRWLAAHPPLVRMHVEVSGTHQQYLCLCVVGSCQLGEDQGDDTLIPPATETVVEGFVGSMGGWVSTRVPAVTWT